MIVFLTSSPSGALNEPNYGKLLDERNGFVDHLKLVWKENMKGLIVSANPTAYEANDEQLDFFANAFRNSGVPLTSFEIWDYRMENLSKEVLHTYDMIMLSGGHVPTQNVFLKQIQLREKLEGYEGVVIGVSAGSMNSANIVYAQPEEAGESSKDFQRFYTGLNLCDINILPHYQMVKDYYLDGRRLYEDIAFEDSMGHEFIVLVDGSYIIVKDTMAYVYGESYVLEDGNFTSLCALNENCRIR